VRRLREHVDEAGRPLLGLIRSLQAKDGRRSCRMIREEPTRYNSASYDEEASDLALDPRPPTLDPDEEVP
jgi:hypothetical protein